MSVRRTEGQGPVLTPRPAATEAAPAPVEKNTVKATSTDAPAASPFAQDGFATKAPAAQTNPLLPSAPQGVGRLPLASAEAQGAIQTTLAGLNAGAPPTLGAAGQEYVPRSVERDALGMTHVRLDRQHEGVKVFGEQVIGHLDKDGKLAGTTGTQSQIPAGLGRETPKLSPAQAEQLGREAFGEKPDKQPAVERTVYQDASGTYHSAYRVEISKTSGEELPRQMNYMLDANTGKLLSQFDQIDGFSAGRHGGHGAHAPSAAAPSAPTAPGTRKADDQTMYSGKVDLSTTKKADGTYTLEDTSRGKGVVTYDAKNAEQASGRTQFTDKNDVWGEASDDPRAKAAVDAHYGAEMTYDFLKDVLGRNSLDNAGEKLTSYVHVSNNFVNAYWDGEKMNYGDGDGKTAGPLTTLDIAGHEIAHGLTERTAGLIYSGESGGLNESFSDIMGAGVEWYASQKNPGVKFNWTVGEAAWTPKNGSNEDGLRYMNDPKKDGYSIDNYKDYPKQQEVHGSSGIANNAFYLLTEGGKNRTSGLEVKGGIGMDKSLKIFGRALTTYMTPKTTFAQAREATLKAATDLYGAKSVELQKVKDAWSAVGVGK